MIRVFLSIILFLAISACSFFKGNNYEQQVKSPCVDANGGPCAHIPVNTWLDSNLYKQVYNKDIA